MPKSSVPIRIETSRVNALRVLAIRNNKTLTAMFDEILEAYTRRPAHTVIAYNEKSGRILTATYPETPPWPAVQKFARETTAPATTVIIGVVEGLYYNTMEKEYPFSEGNGIYCSDVFQDTTP